MYCTCVRKFAQAMTGESSRLFSRGTNKLLGDAVGKLNANSFPKYITSNIYQENLTKKYVLGMQ